MAYSIDGNLYFQKGSKLPQQLTHRPDYRYPISFSDDGDRIFYFQGANQDLYSINVDGTQEQVLLTNSLLLTLGPEYDEATTFCEPILVPHTNFVLVRTCIHNSEGYTTVFQDDLILVDMSTSQVKVLLPRGKGGGYYYPSPDGSMVAIDGVNTIDILGIDGRMIHRNLATYTLSEPYGIAARVYWLADSSGLVLALPINTFYDSSPPPEYEIWRYSLGTGIGTRIKLDPPISGIEPSWVSPDGNWIIYNNYDESSFYLGDLRQGHTQPYTPNEWSRPYGWSSDSAYYVYGNTSGLYLASVNSSPTLIGKSEFIRWLDASRYIYFTSDHGDAPAYILGEIGRSPILALTGNVWPLRQSANIIFYYQP